MSHDAAILLLLLLLTGALLKPPARRRAQSPRVSAPRSLGAHVGPYERWEAERRGQELLRRLLSAEEFRQLQDHGYLDVRSPSVIGRVYRVPRYRGVVERREPGQPAVRLCLVPDRWLPDADIVLMHKFLIEADEPRYLQLANQLAPAASASQASA